MNTEQQPSDNLLEAHAALQNKNQSLEAENTNLREAIEVFLQRFPAHWADGQNMMKHTNIEVSALKPLYAVISQKAV